MGHSVVPSELLRPLTRWTISEPQWGWLVPTQTALFAITAGLQESGSFCVCDEECPGVCFFIERACFVAFVSSPWLLCQFCPSTGGAEGTTTSLCA